MGCKSSYECWDGEDLARSRYLCEPEPVEQTAVKKVAEERARWRPEALRLVSMWGPAAGLAAADEEGGRANGARTFARSYSLPQ